MKQIFVIAFVLCTISLSANNLSDSTRISSIQQAISALDGIEDHCEVPCGIYGDSLRIALIDEHIRTVEKATKMINELSNGSPVNFNQIVRWVNNKEKHAEEIQHIVSQYFLHQRVKIANNMDGKAESRYQSMLKHLHHVLVYAMKTKQGTDLDNIAKLKAAVESFEDVYFHKHNH